MATECFSSVKGLVMRATRLTACGVPVTGLNNQVVSDGFVRVEASAEVEDGTEYKVKKANGTYCINDRSCPLLSWFNMSADFCQVDPDLFSLMAGYDTVVDFDGNVVGYQIGEDSPCLTNFALEVWTEIPGSGACAPGGLSKYLYWLWPWVVDGITGDLTIEDAPVNYTLNARTKSNPNWKCGPYDVVAIDALGTPGRLIAPGVLPKRHVYKTITTIAPPTPGCGFTATPVLSVLNC